MANKQKLFYVATLKQSKPFDFVTSSITIDPNLQVDDLETALAAKYAESHDTFAANLKNPISLNPDTANEAFPDLKTLLEKATCATPEDLIGETFRGRRTLVVLLHRKPSHTPATSVEDQDDSEVNDVVGQLRQDFSKYVKGVMEGKTPSVAAKSSNYNEIQGSDVPLLDGRFNGRAGGQTAAPPIEIYHPAFGAFSKRCKDPELEVPNDVLCHTASLLRSVSKISVQEAPRDSETRVILAKILGVSCEHVMNLNQTLSDLTSVQHTLQSINAAPVLVEVKGELGVDGSDPSVQASFSYARFYCNRERTAVRKRSCCPAFLVGLTGPWLVIMGAVLTSRVIVQRLSPYEWLGCSRVLDDDQVLQVARRLYALRLSIADLKEYYQNLPSPVVQHNHIHPRFCPCINSFSLDCKDVSFVYVQPLERDPSSIIFKAVRCDTQSPIVIKFARRYGEAAHKWMADKRLAPKLLTCKSLGENYNGLLLVVMEFVEGQTLHDAYDSTKPLPKDVRDSVRKALDILAQGDFVFGDLRRPNVMLENENEGEELEVPLEKRIRFIDFDWAGREGSGLRYPFHLASVVLEASGASENDPITRAHQDKMFEKL
ncbi:hypothetical protein F5050DRAFT_1807043 [Lentinula boryana]|uniref:Protein kinase domain-containing protein n=1 Tax=Lentinula boryana TaxID=40481 RepID=A0ABQ8QFG2_9AGAR|nr:hypothetical protein F5050DRAFT_1807043 [Lentinula boryana]